MAAPTVSLAASPNPDAVGSNRDTDLVVAKRDVVQHERGLERFAADGQNHHNYIVHSRDAPL